MTMHAAENSEAGFLSLPLLLERSIPKPRVPWLWYGGGLMMVLLLAGTWLVEPGGDDARTLDFLAGMLMFCLLGVLVGAAWWMGKRHRAEHVQLEAVEELIQLRRWSDAAALLQQMLSRPMRTHPTRIQGLIYLTSVLARYHRYNDAITLYDYLLDHVALDEMTSHGLRLGRVMAMLHEDHLFDADRAIGELRRMAPGLNSGGLALVEIYRDVKTGHAAEAIEIFSQRLDAMREHLGHRLSDAYALAAKAYDVLGRQDDAQQAYENATLLARGQELERRYPELVGLGEKYRAATMPGGIA